MKKNTARDESADADERAQAELRVKDPPPDEAEQALAKLLAETPEESK